MARDSNLSTHPAGTRDDARDGLLTAFAAYGIWGFFPLFFRLLDGISPALVVAHRVVWSFAFVGIILKSRRRMDEVRVAFGDRRTLIIIALSAAVLAVNWLVFIWAVEAQRVLEVSLGYFINPLVNVALGMLFLGERQNRWQILAIAIAVIAMVLQAAGIGGFPWVSLTLAFSFGTYGFLRKTVAVGSAAGLFLETLLMFPVALGVIAYLIASNGWGVHADPKLMGLLVMTGPITAGALLLFAFAARRLRLTTIGMIQYLAPTMHFLTAIWLFGESLNALKLASFGLIWVSLIIFTGDSVWRRGQANKKARAS